MKSTPKLCILWFFYFNFLLFSSAIGQTAKGVIIGKVSSADSKPVESVNISLKDTQFGTFSDAKGEFSLTVPAGSYTVLASVLGFAPQENIVQVTDGQTLNIQFAMIETAAELNAVTITGIRTITGMGYLNEVNDHIIYSGKKTEVLLLDSLDANTAQNNPRQVLGRVPGANYSETDGSGFPSNGIGFRGLDPSQSIGTNTLQNGYSITADLYGYAESYYLPPLEAVDRIEVTRGGASLQFGPQFGGVINYIMKKGSITKPIEFTTQQTGGSFGLYNSYQSVGGQVGKFNYFSYVQYQSIDGWRPNSDYRRVTGFAKVSYQVSKNIKIGLEYSLLRNRIHMPGGLTDSLFALNSRSSFRSRNWLQTPWNILVASLEYKLTPQSTLTLKSSLNVSNRDLVWRNEEGGPLALDNIDPQTNAFSNREVGRQSFRSHTTDIRLLTNYKFGTINNTLAAGVRYFGGNLGRNGGGVGTTGSDFDLSLVEPEFEYSYRFTTRNVAAFVENTFRLTDKLSVTPGLRYEYLHSTVKGYKPDEDGNGKLNIGQAKNRHLLLFGIGAQYKMSAFTNFYTNYAQAYRPIDYSNLTPIGSVSKVDPNLKDASGYNADFGFRGSVKNYLNFDVGYFYLAYNNRIGTLLQNGVSYRTNTGNSVNQGLESYLEFNPLKAFSKHKSWSLSFFNSLALIQAKYVSGEIEGVQLKGKQVEYAPKLINRMGATLVISHFSTTFLVSRTGKSYGDALNSEKPNNDYPQFGIIPAYTVMDWSGSLKIKNFTLKAGVNNLGDQRYFTKRADEYPGPGIIPSIGRSFYFGVGARF
jgi:Fe(3+) dicitrate transport protein